MAFIKGLALPTVPTSAMAAVLNAEGSSGASTPAWAPRRCSAY